MPATPAPQADVPVRSSPGSTKAPAVLEDEQGQGDSRDTPGRAAAGERAGLQIQPEATKRNPKLGLQQFTY